MWSILYRQSAHYYKENGIIEKNPKKTTTNFFKKGKKPKDNGPVIGGAPIMITPYRHNWVLSSGESAKKTTWWAHLKNEFSRLTGGVSCDLRSCGFFSFLLRLSCLYNLSFTMLMQMLYSECCLAACIHLY